MKGRIPKPRIIYDNYDLSESYPDDDMKSILLDEGYTEDEITEEMLWQQRYFLDENEWERTRDALEQFFLYCGDKWMLFGSVGRWNGVYEAGTLFDKFEDFFYKAVEDCNHWKFYDENGHLYLTCSHHDGTCHYEIREVTAQGVQYLENWEDNWNDKRSEQYVHTQIFNKYSRLPQLAKKLYGCKRIEYQPVTKSVLIDKLNNQAKSFYS